MFNGADGFARANAVGVIEEFDLLTIGLHLFELLSVSVLPIPAEQNALRESSVPKNLCRGLCFLGGE